MLYEYEALSEVGEKVKGTVEADSSSEAISKIRNKKLFPTKVRTSKTISNNTTKTKCSKKKSFDFYSIVPKTIMEKVMLVIISLLLMIIAVLIVV